MKPFTRILQVLSAATAFAAPLALAQVHHMVVIGVDGLSPDGLLKASAPNLQRLRQ